MNHRKRARGTTLVEIMIYMSLVTMVFLAIYGVFMAGRRYFEIARASIEVQQAANTIGYRLTRDLMETDASTVQFYPNANFTSAPVGVVFLSARKPVTGAADDNTFQYDNTYGVPNWQKYIGYYLDTDPSYPNDPQMRALYVAEFVPTGFPKLRAEPGSINSVTTATMRTNGRNKRIVAHGVMAPTNARPRGGFDVYSIMNGTKTYLASQNPIYIDLELLNTSAGVTRRAPGANNNNSITSSIRVEARS